MKVTSLCAILATAFAGLTHAATIITPSSASSTTSLSSRSMTEAVNGSDLTATAPDVLNWTHDLTDGTSRYWLSAQNAATGGTEQITLTFASPVTVAQIYVWNYKRNSTSWDDRALGSFDMQFSTDNGSTYPTTITGFQLADTRTGTITSISTQSLGFATQTGVTHIKLTNLQNLHQVYGTGDPDADSNHIGVAEIRFSAIPEPSSALLVASALLVGLLRRRR